MQKINQILCKQKITSMLVYYLRQLAYVDFCVCPGFLRTENFHAYASSLGFCVASGVTQNASVLVFCVQIIVTHFGSVLVFLRTDNCHAYASVLVTPKYRTTSIELYEHS